MGNLVSLTEVKEFMQVTGTASDGLLNIYIALTEKEIETWTKRKLVRATYTETLGYLQSRFDKTGYTLLDASLDAPNFFLKNTPVVAISITSAGSALPTTSYSYDSENGVIDTDSQLTEPTASYVAGYTTVTTPADLKGVIELGVMALFNNNKAASQGSGNVKTKHIKDFSVTYGNEQTGYVTNQSGKLVKNYIASNEHILNAYRRVTV